MKKDETTEIEKVEAIMGLWKDGHYDVAKTILKSYRHSLSEEVYRYLYEKMEISKDIKIPEILLEAQKILGGKIIDEYGIEYNLKK